MTSFLLASLDMTKTAPVAFLGCAEARIGNAAPTPTANIKRLRVTFNICSSLGRQIARDRGGALSDSMESPSRTQLRDCATVGASGDRKVTREMELSLGCGGSNRTCGCIDGTYASDSCAGLSYLLRLAVVAS